ncbi:MAG TPA: T9SS type A sorting domain-containing protein, partial [Ignavibacteria bacterium]|nr:T9SS type A sorting domain-containing protein [Ignavibacteria bacterium]
KKEERGAEEQKEFLEYLYKPYSIKQMADFRNNFLRKNGSVRSLLSDDGTDNSTSWNSIGPKGILPSMAGQFTLSGRVISLALDQVDNNIVYLGSASGGLWKSTNQGASWFQLIDNLNNPSVAAIAIEPNNHNSIWIGSSSMYNGFGGFSARILKSTNAGASWIQMPVGGALQLPSNLKGIHRIAIDNFRNQFIYAATDSGLYRSVNGGVNWIFKYSGQYSDVIVSSSLSDTNSVVIAAIDGFGVIRSTDNGNNFGAPDAMGLAGVFGRISLTHHNLFPVINYVHAIVENRNDGSILGIVKSTDTGSTWSPLMIPPGGPQGDYNNCIMMNPVNPDTILVGWQNRESFRSTDGGSTWNLSTTIHDDYHCYAVSMLNPDLVFLGCDGGVFKSTNFGASWNNAGNAFLSISQIYYLTPHPTNPQAEWAGLQDNGVISGHDGTFAWLSETCCDGGDISFKGADSYVNLAGLGDGSGNWGNFSWERKVASVWQDFTQGIAQVGNVNIPPPDFIYKDPEFFTFHNDTVYITFNGNLPWSKLGVNNASTNGSFVSKLFVTPEFYVYAGINDTNLPLRILNPVSLNWYSPSASLLNGRVITGISGGGMYNSNRIVYISLSGVNGGRVFKSVDNGYNWINITSNLPGIINITGIRAINDKLIFAGSTFGLFATTNAGVSWIDYSANLPSTPHVTDIDYRNFSFPELLIGTYGRGVFSRDVSDLVVSDYKIFTGKVNKNWGDDLNWVPSKPVNGDKALIAVSCNLNETLPVLNTLEIETGDTLNLGSFIMPDITNIYNNGVIITTSPAVNAMPSNKLWGGRVCFNSNLVQYIPPGIFNRLILEGGNRVALGDFTAATQLALHGYFDTLKMGTYQLFGPLAETNDFWTEAVLETHNTSANPLPNNVKWDFKVLFAASANQEIPPGNYFKLGVKNGSIKNLAGNVRVSQGLELAGSVIALNDYNLTMELFSDFQGIEPFSSFNMIRTNLNGKLRRSAFDYSSWYPLLFPVGYISYNPVTLNFQMSLVTDTFAVRVQNVISPPPADSQRVVNVMWTITEENPGGTDASIKVRYNSAQFSGSFNNTNGNVYLARHNGISWTPTIVETITNLGGGEYEATASGFTQFSPFALGNDGALPVQISAFTANVNKNDVKLFWTTAWEINNSGFNIERKKSVENNWIKAGNIAGHGTTKEPVNYYFEDKKLVTGKHLYRLKQFDYNGNYEYFYIPDTVEVGKPKNFRISQNYPNPFNPLTKIDYDIPIDGKVSLKIYDILGREVFNLIKNEYKQAGYYTAEFNGNNLASGIYFYRLTAERFTQVKKMVIVK